MDKKIKFLAVLAAFLVCLVVSLTASAASTSSSVSLSNLQLAAHSDPARPQGGTTSDAIDSVTTVEEALVKEGLLDDKYAHDGSYGTATIKAYKEWQKSLGSPVKYCDGIPGKKDLTKLGQKYGFTVDTSIKTDTETSIKTDTEKKLNVPVLRQDDPRWNDNDGKSPLLGFSTKGNTIASAGCAITSISMVFNYYGVQTDPNNLNTWLKANGGYHGKSGDVDWTQAPGISNGKVNLISQGPADLNKIKSEINNGHPVIVLVTAKSGGTHYVVITGYSGSTYYINDPLKGKSELSYYDDPAKAIYNIWIYY